MNTLKISKNSRRSGTTFYKITEDQLLKFYDKIDNQILRFIVSNNGFDAFNVDLMYGSKLINRVLYLCVTDGRDIEVKGKMVDPESALDDYGISGVSDYVEDGTDDIIQRYITFYELNLTKDFDLNKVAYDIISGNYADFTQVVKDAEELDLLSENSYL